MLGTSRTAVQMIMLEVIALTVVQESYSQSVLQVLSRGARLAAIPIGSPGQERDVALPDCGCGDIVEVRAFEPVLRSHSR